MKYKAYQEKAGTWFVATYITKTTNRGKRFESELEAKQYALIESLVYYSQKKTDDAWDELVKICDQNEDGINDEIKPIGYECYVNQGDMLC